MIPVESSLSSAGKEISSENFIHKKDTWVSILLNCESLAVFTLCTYLYVLQMNEKEVCNMNGAQKKRHVLKLFESVSRCPTPT